MSEGVASSPARPSRGRWLGLRVALVALAALVPARALALEHPPDLVAEGDCEAWVGSVSGNDPSVRVSAQLCPVGEGGVNGRLQWSSLRSGYNVRAIEGRWLDGGKSLELRDVRIVEQHPEPGWMFCTIDRYTLALAFRGRRRVRAGRFVRGSRGRRLL